MIVVHNVTKNFGGICAVNDCSLTIDQGTITGLIGPNGAGKTTLFNIIAGHYIADCGDIRFEGRSIIGQSPHELFQLGLLRTFQIAHEFSSMRVRENLMMVPPNQFGERITARWWRPSQVEQEERVIAARADEVLDFLQISHLADECAGNLSGGQKKLLELGRTMMVDAKIVFLDEVGAGVNRTLLNTIGDAIIRLRDERGYTFCMIEHDMSFIARLCDPVIVMAEGAVLAQGTSAQVTSNERVIEAYLGRGARSIKANT